MTSKTRKTEIIRPKHICQYLIWKIEGAGYEAIGAKFKMKTHVACMKAIKKIEFYEECYEDWRRELAILKARIKNEEGELSSPFLFEELAFTFMTQHPRSFVDTGISEKDVKILADKFKLNIEQIDDLIMNIRKRRKEKEEEDKREEDDKISKQHEDQFNKPKGEKIKNHTDEQDTFGV